MRLHKPRVAIAIAAVTSVIAAAPHAAAAEEAATPVPEVTTTLPGEDHDAVDKDNRKGTVAPTAQQRSLVSGTQVRTRWNRLGTPASLAPGGRTPLATGLSSDPETAARQYLRRSTSLFGLGADQIGDLETIAKPAVGKGTVVLMRQRFGDLPAGHDGLVAVAVKGGDVLRVTSSLTRDSRQPEAATITEDAALAVAAKDADLSLDQVTRKRVRLVAVPTPADGTRAAYEVVLLSDDPLVPKAYTTFVDARNSSVLVRENLVDFDADNPTWAVFPAAPAGSADTRVRWCAVATAGCERAVLDPSTGKAWDIDPATGVSTNTTSGNAAQSTQNWGNVPPAPATPSAERNYTYPWTNQWATSKCDPNALASPDRNDVDAATANLFAMHNRMHDWAYHLGFTEETWNLQKVNREGVPGGGDAEQGRAQSGASSRSFRNNANQATPPDGFTPTTNMYLWQPIAGGIYPPCVDGDFDMTVIGHEYTHAISNRMVAGPDGSIGSFQGGAMGESWSDLMAMEYLFENGFRPPGRTAFVTGGYVTGDLETGIRNYDMSNSPLNYSDIGYDVVGTGVHQDGEIWSATQFDIRRAFIARHGAGTRATQQACADGTTPVTSCPGNRRWAQLVFDSFLLQASGQFSMLDMRDNMLTADALRFDGANYDLLWNAFAARGLGAGAVSGPGDFDPTPSFASPTAENVEVTFRPVGDARGKPVRLYVGKYEAKAVPIADTDPATALPETVTLAAGQYEFLAVGAGLGHKRFLQTIRPGLSDTVPVLMTTNLASAAAGATVSGDGAAHAGLIDDTEATSWQVVDGVAGKRATVDLPGDAAKLVSRVQVSALSSRFTALRQFELLTCNARQGADCSTDEAYKVAFTSAPDAFPGGALRPKAPQLTLRSFTVRPTMATHVRLRVLHNQCTGAPAYAGEQDNDPGIATDCATVSSSGKSVAAAEFQVFSS